MTDYRAEQIFSNLRAQIEQLKKKICCIQTFSGPTDSEPTTPTLGEFYFDTTLTKMKFWNGTTWAIITSTP